jgi:RNA polymerase sigma-70 factor (ECF subfamily)
MQLRSHTDEWLMQEVARENRDALEILIRRHANPLLTFLRRMTHDQHHSEEQFQEVFLLVWRHRHRYDWQRPFRPWLYRIALNRCRTDGRRATLPTVPVPDHEDELQAWREPSPVDTAIATETSTHVAAAVQCLPEKQRTAVVLRIWQNLPYAEIAETLECNEATARSHVFTALAKLRETLGPLLRD